MRRGLTPFQMTLHEPRCKLPSSRWHNFLLSCLKTNLSVLRLGVIVQLLSLSPSTLYSNRVVDQGDKRLLVVCLNYANEPDPLMSRHRAADKTFHDKKLVALSHTLGESHPLVFSELRNFSGSETFSELNRNGFGSDRFF